MTQIITGALGCLAPHPRSKSMRVPLAEVLDPNAPAPAEARDYTGGLTSRPSFGNLTDGDCTICAIINIISTALKIVYGREYSPTDQEALAIYFELTGGQDTGLVIEDVIKYVLKNGFRGHHFIASVAVDPHDIVNVKRGIDWYGSVDLGVGLPLAYQSATDKWPAPPAGTPATGDWAPWGWGGHSAASSKYDKTGLWVWTWGKLVWMSWEAFALYVDTVDVVIPAAWVKAGKSPQHLDLATLEQRMAAIKLAA